MGAFDKFKNFIGVGEEFEDDYDMITEDEINEAEREMESHQERNRFSRGSHRESNVVPMSSIGSDVMKMIVIEPTSFDESPKLVDSLKERKPVIINLEKIESETARKIFDFLSGATYALNGNVQKVANNIFIFAPDNVDISSKDNNVDPEFEFSNIDSQTWR